jgi:hypothetical protein
MDLKTISQQDYIPYDAQKTQSARYDKPDNTGVLKLAGISHYKSEFPSWGHYEFVHIGSFKKAFMNPNIKLDSATTYTENFCGKKQFVKPNIQKKSLKSNPLTASGMFFAQTTSRDSFKTFKKRHFPERTKNKAFGIVPLESGPNCYETMYKTQYDKKESPIFYSRKKDIIN